MHNSTRNFDVKQLKADRRDDEEEAEEKDRNVQVQQIQVAVSWPWPWHRPSISPKKTTGDRKSRQKPNHRHTQLWRWSYLRDGQAKTGAPDGHTRLHTHTHTACVCVCVGLAEHKVELLRISKAGASLQWLAHCPLVPPPSIGLPTCDQQVDAS